MVTAGPALSSPPSSGNKLRGMHRRGYVARGAGSTPETSLPVALLATSRRDQRTYGVFGGVVHSFRFTRRGYASVLVIDALVR
jgi:hypothetical protein